MNPGQSIKDRAALGILWDARQKGALRPGGTIVEGTAGNTGIGLAVLGAALGYRVVIVLPRNQSEEKKQAIRMAGAELIEVDPVPYANQNHYTHTSRRLAEERARTDPNGAIWANQFDNTANRESHRLTTGPEIWNQTEGKIDGFICSVGTGGTLGGVSMHLKDRNPAIRIGIADPMGANLYHYYKDGELRGEGSSITEGIGQSRITGNLQDVVVDDPYQVTDEEALTILFALTQEEGLCLGGSSGINVGGAMKLARDLGPGHTVVTVLCDYGHRYASKLYNPAFLREKGLPAPGWMEG
jgi:cysteine synthase A